MSDDCLNKPMDSDLPSRIAYRFVEFMATKGIRLQFDHQSLVEDFERSLEDECSSPIDTVIEVDGKYFDLETGAACFFGEALRREYSGIWYGMLGPRAGPNYYTTNIRFGKYMFFPFRWIGYRLSNGRDSEGTVACCLRAVTPSMKDGVDYKEKRGEAIIASGKVWFDSDIF